MCGSTAFIRWSHARAPLRTEPAAEKAALILKPHSEYKLQDGDMGHVIALDASVALIISACAKQSLKIPPQRKPSTSFVAAFGSHRQESGRPDEVAHGMGDMPRAVAKASSGGAPHRPRRLRFGKGALEGTSRGSRGSSRFQLKRTFHSYRLGSGRNVAPKEAMCSNSLADNVDPVWLKKQTAILNHPATPQQLREMWPPPSPVAVSRVASNPMNPPQRSLIAMIRKRLRGDAGADEPPAAPPTTPSTTRESTRANFRSWKNCPLSRSRQKKQQAGASDRSSLSIEIDEPSVAAGEALSPSRCARCPRGVSMWRT